MSAPAAISGSFADYRLVKSRSVLQLVIEVPVEQQGAAFAALGYPLPGTEIPVAVARMNSPAGTHQPSNERIEATGSSPGKDAPRPVGEPSSAYQRYHNASAPQRAVMRAAMLAKDVRFRAWIPQQDDCPFGTPFDTVSETEAEIYIRTRCCGSNSRKLIAEVPEYMDRFLMMETEFKIAVGEAAEPR